MKTKIKIEVRDDGIRYVKKEDWEFTIFPKEQNRCYAIYREKSGTVKDYYIRGNVIFTTEEENYGKYDPTQEKLYEILEVLNRTDQL